jgi:PAS domain S-box-containing protein
MTKSGIKHKLTASMIELIDKAFVTFQTVAGEDIFITLIPQAPEDYAEQQPAMEWTNGCFLPYQNKPLIKSAEPLSAFLTQAFMADHKLSLKVFPDTTTFPDQVDSEFFDPAFSTLLPGSLALIPIDLSGKLIAVAGYWQDAKSGPIAQKKLTALRAFAELIELASASFDLSQDVQTQQLHLASLQEEMEELELFYRQYSEAISQCFWVIDTNLERVVLTSENFERVWGAKRSILDDGLTGFMASVYPDDRDRVLSAFHIALGTTLNTELRVIDVQGELRWMWLRSFPTCEVTADGGPAKLVMIADDVTEKKQHEEVLRNREARIVDYAKNLAVSNLATGVAHEINNPLTVIVGKASELKRLATNQNLDSPTAQKLADKIESMAVRISKIILSLKALARQDSEPQMHPSSFKHLLKDLADLTTEKFKHAGISLILPDIKNDFTIEMNPTLISQLLLNLIDNAFDAVSNQKSPWVQLEYTEDQESLFVSVTDSGNGIPIKIRNQIFDPFFTTKDPGKGTGLGLSLAFSIAAHHGGSLRLDHLSPHTRFVLQIRKKHPKKIQKDLFDSTLSKTKRVA